MIDRLHQRRHFFMSSKLPGSRPTMVPIVSRIAGFGLLLAASAAGQAPALEAASTTQVGETYVRQWLAGEVSPELKSALGARPRASERTTREPSPEKNLSDALESLRRRSRSSSGDAD
ncbi:MAG: hypothetical protein AAGM22_09855, partial [Acidobacteriota bacterium]